MAHGPFEGSAPTCPHGCTVAVEREFRTAPGGRSAKTKATDNALNRLAQRFGYTDISNRNGTVAGSKKAPQYDFRPTWGELPKGDKLVVGKGIEQVAGATGGAEAAAKLYHTEQVSEDEPVPSVTMPLPIGGKLPKLRPNVVGRDTVTPAEFSDALARAT